MRFLGQAVLLLAATTAPAYAQEESSKDRTIEELEKKVEALEARLGKLEQPDSSVNQAEPKAEAGLETRLDETIRQSTAEPLREPMRLNFTAPRNVAVEFDGEVRVIGLWWNAYSNGVNEDNSLDFGESVDLGFNIKVSEKTRAYIELHDGRIWGATAFPGTNEDNENGQENFYLNQAYIAVADIFDSGIDLTFGRQTLEYGAERQIGDDDWLLNRTAFEGFVFHNDMGDGNSADVGLIRLGDGDTVFDNEIFPGGAQPSQDTTNAEAYYTYFTHKCEELGTIEAYLIFIDGDAHSNLGGDVGSPNHTLDTRYLTYGGRWAQSADMFYWDTEFATQTGRFVGTETHDYGFDVLAFTARVGAKFDDVEVLDKIYIGYDYASGDGDATDNENSTYVQLAPQLHGWFGIMDFASWTNVVQYYLGTTLEAPHGAVDVSYRWLQKENDMGAAGGYNFASGAGTDVGTNIGQELDVVYTVECAQNQVADMGLGVFLPDDVYENTTGSHDYVWFGYMQYRLKF